MTTNVTKTKKPQYQTEAILKDDGVTVHVARCALQHLDQMIEIQDRLIEKYVECDGAVAKILMSSDVVADLTTMCSFLPIVGTREESYLKYEDISENWEQLILLFFNGSLNIKTRELGDLTPGRIAKMHFLPYMEMFGTHLQKKAERQKEEASSQS